MLVLVQEMRLIVFGRSILILNFGIDPAFGLVIHPLPYKELVLLAEVIRALTLSLIVYPVAFKVISISLGKHPITVALALMPLTFIDVFVGIDDSSFSLRIAHDPEAIVSVSILVEEGASAMAFIFHPVSSILSS